MADYLVELQELYENKGFDLLEQDHEVLVARHEELRTLVSADVTSVTHPNKTNLVLLIAAIDNLLLSLTYEEPDGLLATSFPNGKLDLLAFCAEQEAENATQMITNCSTVAASLVERSKDLTILILANSYLVSLTNAEADYLTVMNTIYEDGLDLIESAANHTSCLGLLRNNSPPLIQAIEDLVNSTGRFYNVTTFAERLNLAYDLQAFTNKTKTDELYQRFVDPTEGFAPCLAYRDPSYHTRIDPMDRYEDTFRQFQDDVDMAESKADYWVDRMDRFIATALPIMDDIVKPFRDRLAGNITKAEMAVAIKTGQFTKQQADVDELLRKLSSSLPNMRQYLRAAKITVRDLFQMPAESPLPVLTEKGVQSLQYPVPYNSSSGLTRRENYALEGPPDNGLNRMAQSLSTKETTLHQTDASFGELVTKVKVDLQAFLDLANIHRDSFFSENFVKVDFFYKEMSYTHVSQQVAFSFISLLSEIGGFLGLLLGASVLTVCEVLDFLAFAALDKLKRGRYVKPSSTVHFVNVNPKEKLML